MDPIGLAQFAAVVGGTIQTAGAHDGATDHRATIHRVTVHSGQIQAGSAFFALPGRQTDGHLHAQEALRGGATAVVVSRDRAHLIAGGPLVVVDDALAALQRLATWWRSTLSCTVVAVVGSNGKTVTKDALVHVASASFRTYGSPGSYNSQLGVALALLECPPDCDLAVIEAAASEPGEMARLAAMVRPDHVIVTYLGSRYVARFGDLGAYARELLAMTADLPSHGWVLAGHDDPRLMAAAEAATGTWHLQGVGAPNLPSFTSTGGQPGSLTLRIAFPDGGTKDLTVGTTSQDVMSDVALAVTASWLLRPESARIIATPGDYSPTSTTVETWQTSTGVTMVRDAATADPITFSTALRTARRLAGPKGRTFVVLADPMSAVGTADAEALGRIIGSGGAYGLCGFDTPTHHAVAGALRTADPTLPVRLFDDTPAMRAHLIAELRGSDVALVEAPPGRSIVDLSRDLLESMGPTRLYIDLTAVESNVMTFRRLVGPTTRILGVVKALAYGTNPVQVSASLQDAGVDFLGVSSADEGAALRRAGVRLPVLVMLGTSTEVEKMVRHHLVPLVYSPAMLDAVLAEAAQRVGVGGDPEPIGVHLEVDSGMHRTGFSPRYAVEVLRRLRDAPGIRLEGIMTHLGCADMPGEDDFTRSQLRRYSAVVDEAYALGFTGFLRHAAATAATIRFPEARLDMVRIGIGLYGVQPSEATRARLDLTPAVSLVSRIVESYDLAEGDRVGYGGTYAAPAGGSRIGVVPAGYHDCVPRAFSNFGSVTVGGEQCRIIGIVSMDSMTIDLSACAGAQLGSDVLIYGTYAGAAVSLEEVSAAIGTIGYELLVRVGPRVQRIFTRH